MQEEPNPWMNASVKEVPRRAKFLNQVEGIRKPLTESNNSSSTPSGGKANATSTVSSSSLPQTIHTGVLAVRPETKDLLICAAGAGLRRFNFDAVFNDRSQQDEVYRHTTAPVVAEFLNGMNGSVFAFGQTGSGRLLRKIEASCTSSLLTLAIVMVLPVREDLYDVWA